MGRRFWRGDEAMLELEHRLFSRWRNRGANVKPPGGNEHKKIKIFKTCTKRCKYFAMTTIWGPFG